MATKRRSCGCKLDGADLGLGWQFKGQCECSIMTHRKRGQQQKRERALEQQRLAAEKLMQEVARTSPDLIRPISAFSLKLQAKLFEFVGEPDLLDLL